VSDADRPGLPPLLYLSAADVSALMPPVAERLDLAERAMTALATPGASELPPKIGIHARPTGSFAHAMPAHLRAPGDDAGADLVGMKWVSVFRENKARGLPATNATVVLNDPSTGLPTAILDGGPITAQRTAAVSGVAVRLFAPPVAGRALRAGIVGAGAQGISHLEVIGFLMPGVSLAIHDRHPDRAEALAARAAATAGIAASATVPSPRAAAEGADVVISAASMAPPEARQAMTTDWLGPETLVVAVDYATFCSAEVARGAALFVVDERGQFLANRDAGLFDGFPDPDLTIGDALIAGTARPAGRVVVNHLGVGLADLVFAEALVRAARASGRGTILPR
jgi:ornithine cyclodeaminase/alanine dehydrogenase-like protein (mu-crystallin family)